MQIQNQFDIPVPPAAAWEILMNVPETAACFPGASHITQTAPDEYQGRVTVKLGPIAMVFAGDMRLENRDDAAHTAVVNATWRETKGRGNAVTSTRFALGAEAEGTRVTLQTELQLAGQVAQYGRGVGMLNDISAQLIATFAQNLRQRIDATLRGMAASTPAASEISGLTLLAKALGNKLRG